MSLSFYWKNIMKFWTKLEIYWTFHSMPVYDKKYIKSKIKIFNGVVR